MNALALHDLVAVLTPNAEPPPAPSFDELCDCAALVGFAAGAEDRNARLRRIDAARARRERSR